MRYYKISEPDLMDLLEASYLLEALAAGGVDNWEWYDRSCEDFLNEIREETNFDYVNFREVASDDIASFELIVENE